jgi:DNA-binding NtrC family response regulator
VDKSTPVLVIDRINRPAEVWQQVSDLAGTGPVTMVSSPEDAEIELGSGRFGLVFCSYVLPDETGTELFARLRSQGVKTPVIFLSDQFDTKGLIEAAKLKQADFLPAPFNVSDLRNRLSLLTGTPAQV